MTLDRSGSSQSESKRRRRGGKTPGSSRLIMLSGFRFLWYHPWLFGLSVLGVALGVAMVVAIDLANTSANRAFKLSAETVTGPATHQLYATSGNIDDALYTKLRTEARFRNVAPVITGYATYKATGRTFQVIGTDPVAENAFRSYASQDAGIDLGTFMARGNTGMITLQTAENLDISEGDTIGLQIDGVMRNLIISGFIEPEDERSRLGLESVIVVDVGTAQNLFEMQGSLSRIDLILPDDTTNPEYQRIRKLLPAGVLIERAEERTESMEQMTAAFELNLNALSMLALLVGMFLIYSTMSFSVVRRRPVIGRLRALGASRYEIFKMIFGEALLIGALGTLAGLALGVVLAHSLLQLVTQTINDLYFVLTISELTLDTWTMTKGILLGICATLAATFFPAREAAYSSVSTVLKASSRETGMKNAMFWLVISGVIIFVAGLSLLWIPVTNITISYLALLLMILGFALLTPFLIHALNRVFRPVLSFFFGITGRMACRGIVTNLSRTAVAIGALSVAVAATIGVGIMIDSFRTTIEVWMDEQLQGDIHIHAPSRVVRQADASFDRSVVDDFIHADGVKHIHTSRHTEVRTNLGNSRLVAIEQGFEGRQVFPVKTGVSGLWENYQDKHQIYITEVFSNRHNVGMGDTIWMETAIGRRAFPVGAVYYDYGSDIGVVAMSRSVYDQYFDDRMISSLIIYAESGEDIEAMTERFRGMVPADRELIIRSSSALRKASMDVFDRTFAITNILRLLTLLVAFVGVLSALMALQLERSKELAVLRANGMTPGQLWRYISLQTGLMGLKAGILAIPLGLTMAAVLVYVINLRSFGWTLQFLVSPGILAQAVFLAIGAAIIAGIYPSWKMAQTNPAEALRNE